MIGQCLRFSPEYIKLKEYIDSGWRLGTYGPESSLLSLKIALREKESALKGVAVHV